MVNSQFPMIVLTGGPGAGKTAVLEMIRRAVGPRVAMLPEAAGILFGGGFLRLPSENARRCSQRAIFQVQTELEKVAMGEDSYGAAICDRGTLDGFAYWPGAIEDFLSELRIDRGRQLAKYHMVVHLRTPSDGAYNHQNPLRIESADQAARIDQLIVRAWEGHPRRVFVDSTDDFRQKAQRAVDLILEELRVLGVETNTAKR